VDVHDSLGVLLIRVGRGDDEGHHRAAGQRRQLCPPEDPLAALLVGVFAFTLLYLYLMALRLRVGRLEDRVVAEALSPRVGQSPESLLAGGEDGAGDGSAGTAEPQEVSARG